MMRLLTFWLWPLCETRTSTDPSRSAYQLMASSPCRNTVQRVARVGGDGSRLVGCLCVCVLRNVGMILLICWRVRVPNRRSNRRRFLPVYSCICKSPSVSRLLGRRKF